MDKHCSIILINWNGWKDTVECLESILKLDYKTFDIIIVDNDSSDDSIVKINQWAVNEEFEIETRYPSLVYPKASRPITIIEFEIDEIKSVKNLDIKKHPAIYLIKNYENSGFAIANNIAMKFAINILNSDFVYLLNNDTVIEKNTLRSLIKSYDMHPEYAALQSAIFYYSMPKKIWHIGGKILPWLQTKKYHRFGDKTIKVSEILAGCALFIPTKTINKIGFLTDRFFHAEEDFEFSMRIKKNNLSGATVLTSRVYHKVGTSKNKQLKKDGAKILNSALNRLIHMKTYLHGFRWQIWRFFTMLYYYGLMVGRHKLTPLYALRLFIEIYHSSTMLDRVTMESTRDILSKIND